MIQNNNSKVDLTKIGVPTKNLNLSRAESQASQNLQQLASAEAKADSQLGQMSNMINNVGKNKTFL